MLDIEKIDALCGDWPAPCNCDDPKTHDGSVPEPSTCLIEHPITGTRCSLPAEPRHAHVCDLPAEPQGEPSVPPRPTTDEFASLPVADLSQFRAQGEPSDAEVKAAQGAINLVFCRADTRELGAEGWGRLYREMAVAALRAASAVTEQGENR